LVFIGPIGVVAVMGAAVVFMGAMEVVGVIVVGGGRVGSYKLKDFFNLTVLSWTQSSGSL
jgi:hypothetical protein